MPGVTVQDLSKKYGSVIAVDKVGFNGNKETVALLGPSGCGKTTTLRCIAGLETPDTGEIFIDDVLVSAPAKRIMVPPEKRDIGMVFQNYALWPHMKVGDNVAYGLKRRHFPQQQIAERVKKTLELVELSGMSDRYPSQLSGGQQQRVALARALVYEPKILLLDEPLSNLDARLRERTRGELKRLLHQIGVTSLYVTHDQEEAFVIADKLVVMNRGMIAQEGSPEKVYEKPANEFVADFMGRANIVQGKVERVGDKTSSVSLVDLDAVIEVPRMDWFSVGSGCAVSLRSNKINMFFEKPVKNNVMAGEVVLKEYKGAMTDYRVRVSRKELVVSSQTGSLVEGTKVYLQIEPENIVVIEKEQKGAA